MCLFNVERAVKLIVVRPTIPIEFNWNVATRIYIICVLFIYRASTAYLNTEQRPTLARTHKKKMKNKIDTKKATQLIERCHRYSTRMPPCWLDRTAARTQGHARKHSKHLKFNWHSNGYCLHSNNNNIWLCARYHELVLPLSHPPPNRWRRYAYIANTDLWVFGGGYESNVY